MKIWLALALNVFFASVLISCGGGGGGGVSSGDSYSSTPNTYTYSAPSSQTNPNIAVASAPSGAASSTSISISGSSANLPVISVTVCEPRNTNRCNTIPDVLLDTGSYGLRLFSSSLSLNLPQSSVAGKPLYEKTDFLSGSVWGSVVNADVYLADQIASVIPIQLIQSSYPPSMASHTKRFITKSSELGNANGIIGVGALLQDCGTSCAYSAFNSPYYTYDSASGTVTQTALPISQQIPNPVAKLSSAAYTGGIQIDLTSISANNLTATSGFVLGVPTRLPNNTVKLALNSSADFSTGYTAQTTGSSQSTLTSFIDSGSNAYFFPDSGISCSGNSFGFYCPSTPLSLTASMFNASIVNAVTGDLVNQTIPVSFAVKNYSGATTAFQPNLAGYLSQYFDWGLPFFYAHKVYVGFEQQDNSGNTIGNGYTAFSP